MGQIITGLILAAIASMLFKSNHRLPALGFAAVALFLVWPGSSHIFALLFGQLLSVLYYAGPALGMLVGAICGIRLMFGLSALPKNFKLF